MRLSELQTKEIINMSTGKRLGLIIDVIVDNTGLRFSASMAIPSIVLINETESAPSASTALAISVMSVTLGESFTIRVFG